jgi:Xaa-Pro dipeptidase
MVHRSELEERQARTREALAPSGLDGALALGRSFYDRPGPCAWLCGHHPPFLAAAPHPGLRGAGQAAFVLPADGASTLVCDPTGAREDLVVADDIRRADDLWAELVTTLRRSGLAGGHVGLAGADLLPAEAAQLVHAELPALALHPLDPVIDVWRQIKSPHEQELLARAAACADAALARTIATLRDGGSERAAAAAGTAAALLAGADHVRYLRVHSGPWSERTARWPPALDRVPEQGELVMVDVIGACDGYAFDIARTIAIGTQRGAWRALLEACAAASDVAAQACRAGHTVGDVLDAGAAVYAAAGFAGEARAFAGHGIGIETVESPLLSPAARDVELRAGMTLCIEPGVTAPGVGGALIEHELVVRDGPPRLLSATPTLS